MRPTTLLLLASVLTLTTACKRSEPDTTDHSVAHELGKAAYKVSKESEKIAKKAGQEIKVGAKEAHQGWKDAQRTDKAKAK
jgi:hypothetical protein